MTAIVTPPSPIDPVPPVASSPPREVARRRGIRRATLPTPPYGDHGILTDDGERVQCHICGRWFDNLGSHTARAHRVSARSYKARFGLKMSVGLIGPALRARRSARAKARVGTPAFTRFVEAGRKARMPRESTADRAIPAEEIESESAASVELATPAEGRPWRRVRKRWLSREESRSTGGMSSVTVVLPKTESPDELVSSLAAVLCQSYPGPIEIIVSADAGGAEAIARLPAIMPDVTVSDIGPGDPASDEPFSEPDWAEGDVLVFLDPRTEIGPLWLAALVQPFAPNGSGEGAQTSKVVAVDEDGELIVADAKEIVSEPESSTGGLATERWKSFAIPTELFRRRLERGDRHATGLPVPNLTWSDIVARLAPGLPTGVPPSVVAPDAVGPPSRRSAASGMPALAGVALVIMGLAEVITAFVDIQWGIIVHAILLAILVADGARAAYVAGPVTGSETGTPERLRANFAAALALAPLTRIVSLAMPLTEFPQVAWYLVAASPMVIAAWAAAQASGYSRHDLGLRLDLRPRNLAITAAIGLVGLPLGYAEYRILTPEPLVDPLSPLPVFAAVITLALGTGFTEEVIFRGVLQRAASEYLSVPIGIVYAGAVFAILHVGHRSALDVVFVFGVALAFSAVVRATGTLAGVILAHSLTNISLFLIFPHLANGG